MSFNDDYYKAKTPDTHKEEMERLCEELEKSDLIEHALIRPRVAQNQFWDQ